MTFSLEETIRSAIKRLSAERDVASNDLWQHLAMERLLNRMAKSPYAKHFVLKGGFLLMKYADFKRETRDLDFLVRKFKNNAKTLKLAFEKISSIDLNDGFIFSNVSSILLSHPHMPYTGARITMIAHFEKSQIRLQIDLGFGDHVKPIPKVLSLISIAHYEKSISLLCYPLEFIFAEKLESIFSRGGVNTRMKDFFDIYSLIFQKNLLNIYLLKEIIPTVFSHRKTALQFPLKFKKKDIEQFQKHWSKFLQTLRVSKSRDQIPSKIEHLIHSVNLWLLEHFSQYNSLQSRSKTCKITSP